MGSTYYYYYELDSTVETTSLTHPATTTNCPYLPGQPLNTLIIPHLSPPTDRSCSASMSSLRAADWATLRPSDRFVSPRAAPSPTPSPVSLPGTAPSMIVLYKDKETPTSGSKEPKTLERILRHKASSRSLSPAPSWRRFFRGFRERDRSVDRELEDADHDRAIRPSQPRSVSYNSAAPLHSPTPQAATARPLDMDTPADPYARSSSRMTNRSREISPESLRRFLISDMPRSGSSLSISSQPEVFVTPAPDNLPLSSTPLSSRPVSSRSTRSFTLPTSLTPYHQLQPQLPSPSPLAAAPVITASPRTSMDAFDDDEDEDDDSDNFASPVAPDTPVAFTTFLSPPPAAAVARRSRPGRLDVEGARGVGYKLTGALHSPIFKQEGENDGDENESSGGFEGEDGDMDVEMVYLKGKGDWMVEMRRGSSK